MIHGRVVKGVVGLEKEEKKNKHRGRRTKKRKDERQKLLDGNTQIEEKRERKIFVADNGLAERCMYMYIERIEGDLCCSMNVFDTMQIVTQCRTLSSPYR